MPFPMAEFAKKIGKNMMQNGENMLKLNEFCYNHHPYGVKILAKLIQTVFPVLLLFCIRLTFLYVPQSNNMISTGEQLWTNGWKKTGCIIASGVSSSIWQHPLAATPTVQAT